MTQTDIISYLLKVPAVKNGLSFISRDGVNKKLGLYSRTNKIQPIP